MRTSKSKNNQVRKLAWISLAGQGGFFCITVLLHFLRPDYDPFSRFISEYAVGSYSLFMVSAFALLGCGSLSLTAGLYLDAFFSNQKYSRAGIITLGVWSISVLAVGLFPTNLKDEPFTASGIIHGVAAMLAFVNLLIAAFLLANKFKNHVRWYPLHRSALFLAWTMLISLIAFFVSPSEFKGLTERWLVIIFIAWLSLVSLWLLYGRQSKVGDK